MKRYKNLVIGGIESKFINLILLTIILLTSAFMAVSVYHSNMLSRLVAESGEHQKAAIEETTNLVMDSVIEKTMSRSTSLEAYIADDLFQSLEIRVKMLGEYAGKLFSDPQSYPRVPYAAPDPARNGEVVAQLILADGTDGSEAELADRIGLMANMSDLMVSLFGVSVETNSCFIALPDGVFLVADDRSASKFDEEGRKISYDPCTRPWYQQAVTEGGLIFTDVEIDAFTGDIGIVCAMPVYVDGELAAVVGSDLFLTSMQEAVQASEENGAFLCVINQNGHVVFSPKTEGVFQVLPASQAYDLRHSENEQLAALLKDAMTEITDIRPVQLEDGDYYMIGAPMATVGWELISVCSRAAAQEPTVMLKQSYDQIQQEASQAYQSKTERSRTTSLVLLGLVTVLMLSASVLLGKRIVKPLNTITKRISELKEGNLEFKMEDAYRTGDEIEELAQSFATISHKTVEYVYKIRKVTAEKERINTELSLANDIQRAMLPHIFPAFPERSDFDIYACMDPAKEVGGDFYDYFLVDGDHLCMIIADVSGKGVPAALFMMASKIILQSCAMLGSSVVEILTKTNEAICSNNEAEMFVTVWLGILELSTGRLSAANAGHEYPVVKYPDGQFAVLKDKHGFVLGGMDGAKYVEYELLLRPGTKLFVHTDGVTEATNVRNELFGTKRMLEALNSQPDAAPQQVLNNVRRAVNSFALGAEQFDDLTMLCLEYKGICSESYVSEQIQEAHHS